MLTKFNNNFDLFGLILFILFLCFLKYIHKIDKNKSKNKNERNFGDSNQIYYIVKVDKTDFNIFGNKLLFNVHGYIDEICKSLNPSKIIIFFDDDDFQLKYKNYLYKYINAEKQIRTIFKK